MRPRVGVSSCLLGEPVRFNGGHSRHRFLTDELGRYVDWVPVCPEMEIGLGSPRETLRLTADDRLISRSGDTDHTAAMAALTLPADLDGYVFKGKSPSCGTRGIPRYRDNGQPADRRGRGVFAARLMAAQPLLPVEDDGRLNDNLLRENFVERIFARGRLRELFAGDWRPRELVDFHTRHKLQMLAHDPARYRQAGRLVAEAGSRPRTDVEADYRDVFNTVMTGKATRGRTTNALHHAFGQISETLDDRRRHDIVATIENYRTGRVPLSVPVALLTHHTAGNGLEWVAGQTFLSPFPNDLHLRHHL